MPKNHILTIAPAFADLNSDGYLDVFTGNWSLGPLVARKSIPAARNYLFLSTPKGYEISNMEHG